MRSQTTTPRALSRLELKAPARDVKGQRLKKKKKKNLNETLLEHSKCKALSRGLTHE